VTDDFADVAAAQDRLAEHGYLSDDRLATTVFLQSRLAKPLLLEGPAGVGKTQLATTLAEATGRRLLRLQCYEGQDESKALYEWDYGKQLLYTQILREKIGQVVEDAADLNEAVERIAKQDSVFFSERFLAPRPLLEAITSEQPVVLLIDEVDRADEALEAVLLELLSEFQISIPEVGTVKAKVIPYVVLTSNNTRDLSAALKRRCLHMFLDYPTAERELAIVRSKDTGLPEALAVRLVEIVRGLRELELRKAPSISETIDWARTLAVLGVSELDGEVLGQTLNVVVKYERDLRRATEALPRLVDPNASVPSSKGGHGHGHGHGHGSASGGTHSHDDGDVDGRAKRAAKDQPGRHDENYYGAPGNGPGVRSVSADKGKRSFAAGARKRPV
jgi:MoxR-like ATPase